MRSILFVFAFALFSSIVCLLLMVTEAGRDFSCFHAAARILASGGDPYDPAAQAAAQAAQSDRPGLGGYYKHTGFMPYFYPPWFALASMPLVAFPFPTARLIWIYLGGFAVGTAVVILGRALPAGMRPASLALLTLLPASLLAIGFGQTPPWVILMTIAAWMSLESGRDRLAGGVLAWLTFKPQMLAPAIGGVLLWSIRRGRRGVVGSFAATLTMLLVASFLAVPAWPSEMASGIRAYPPPSQIFPAYGVTWSDLLRTIGLAGWPLRIGYGGLALASLGTLAMRAWDRRSGVVDIVGGGLIAAFFTSPYALNYEFAVLLLPLAVTFSGLPAIACVALAFLSSGHFIATVVADSAGRFTLCPPISQFWLPALLASLWITGHPVRRTLSGVVTETSACPSSPGR